MLANEVEDNAHFCDLLTQKVQLASGVTVVGPVWSGGIDIFGGFHGELDGLELFMPPTSYLKVAKVLQGTTPSLCFSMKKRDALWPKNLDDLEATHRDIELILFPKVSRSETLYDTLVEHMIAEDLAMTSCLGSFEMIIFTSLEQEANQQHFQGKYYLWGMFRGKGTRQYKSWNAKKTSALKSKISQCTGSGPKKGTKSNMRKPVQKIKRVRIELSPIAESKHRKKQRKSPMILSSVQRDLIQLPSLSQVCKRPRSKRRRKSNKEGFVCDSVTANLSGKERMYQPSNTRLALNSSRQVTFCSVEPSAGEVVQVTEMNQAKCVHDVILQTKVAESLNHKQDNLLIREGTTGISRDDETNEGLNNKQDDVCGTFVEPRPCYSDGLSQPELVSCTVEKRVAEIDETQEAEERSWGTDMDISESSEPYCTNRQDEVCSRISCDETTEVKQHSWNSDMDISEPSELCGFNRVEENSSLLINCKVDGREENEGCSELQLRSCLSQGTCPLTISLNPSLESKENSTIDMPNRASNSGMDLLSDDNILHKNVDDHNSTEDKDVIILATRENALQLPAPVNLTDPHATPSVIQMVECSELQRQGNSVSQSPDSKDCSCLTPLFYFEEKREDEKIDHIICEGINICSEDQPLGTLSKSLIKDHQNNLDDKVQGTCQVSTGKLTDRRDPHPDADSCTTPSPLEEQLEQSTSSNATVILELDEEQSEQSAYSNATVILVLDEEDSTSNETRNFEDGTDSLAESFMLKMVADLSETSSNEVVTQVCQYMIKSDLAPILRKILDKYGDIASGCSIMPEMLLKDICKAFQELESVPFSGLRRHHLDRLRNMCQLAEAVGFEMAWLSKQCDELEETALHISEYRYLKGELERCNKAIRSFEEKLDPKRVANAEFLEEIESVEAQLETEKERQDSLQYEIEYVRSVSRRFVGRSLADALY